MFKASMDELYNALKDFHNVTGFLIVIYDSERHTIASYPQKMCDFCREVRKSPVLAKKCIECDNMGFDICDRTKKPYIYKCHMSVVEAIAPIYFNNTNIGYLMFGQILRRNHSDVYEKAAVTSALYGIRLNDDMINEMTVADDDTISSAVNMMTMCATYLYTNEIIRKSTDLLAERLKDHVSENLCGDLSLEEVCERFYISRAKLYSVSRSAFGMGFSDYVRTRRLKEAKKLLRTTDLSISRIAEHVGIGDTNYFIRIFKSHEGMTPLKYRNK